MCVLCALARQWGSRGNADGRQIVTAIKASAVCGAINTWDPDSEQTGRLTRPGVEGTIAPVEGKENFGKGTSET